MIAMHDIEENQMDTEETEEIPKAELGWEDNERNSICEP
jgi:hypothetical protein